MSSTTASPTPQIPVHPALAKIAQDGQPAESTIRFGGYVGPASQSGQVRLYTALEDLSHYLEFDATSVVQTADAAETELPGQGIWIWLKSSSPVRWTREYPSASSFNDTIRANLAQATATTTQS